MRVGAALAKRLRMMTPRAAAEEIIVIESRRRRRDDEPTFRDDVTLPDIDSGERDEEEHECARTST